MKIAITFILVMIVLNSPVVIAEEMTVQDDLSRENIILQQLDKLNLEELEREVADINRSVEGFLPEINFKKLLLGFVRGNLDLAWGNILKSLLRYLGQEVTANLKLLGQILILAVVASIFNVFQESFSSKTISKAASMLIFLLLAVLILQSFHLAINIGINSVTNMVSFMQALLPILLTLLVSLGAVTSAAIFHPLTFLIVSALATAIKNIVLPMIFIATVLNIVDNIADEFRISRLAGLFKEFSIGLLSLIMMVFIGGLLLQGGAAAITDSLTLRTAKFLTGTFIPVIGGIFSDAVDLIISCSLIIKNALNLFGVIVILLIIIYPLLKIVALIFIYKLAGAMLQPISDERLVNILNGLGNSLVLVFVVVIAVALMFFIIITILVGTANLTVMMR